MKGMEKKKTAVEWLIGELEKSHVKQNLLDTVAYQQAKEMERLQMKDFYERGKFGGKVDTYYEFEEYYNENFNKIGHI